MDVLKQLIKQFMPFAQEKMGFDRPPRLFLRQDDANGADPLGKTGFYDPQAESITIYVSKRHPKDILRSLAHELMHHTQKCNGDFDTAESQGMGEQGYAQNNVHMRTMEIQAYQASIVFRDWEDSLKETIYYEHLQKGANKLMSTKDWKNGEITTLLSEAWGFKFDSSREFDEFNEGADINTGLDSPKRKKGGRSTSYGHEVTEEGGLANRRGDPRQRRPEASSIREDSGQDEAWNDWKNEHADDDHIREMKHHLRALKEDRDYERHGAEYDHDKDEDEGYSRDESMRRQAIVNEVSRRVAARLTQQTRKDASADELANRILHRLTK